MNITELIEKFEEMPVDEEVYIELNGKTYEVFEIDSVKIDPQTGAVHIVVS